MPMRAQMHKDAPAEEGNLDFRFQISDFSLPAERRVNSRPREKDFGAI